MNVLEFKKNTRNMFPEVVQYLAAIADEWETKYPHALHSRVWVLCTNEVLCIQVHRIHCVAYVLGTRTGPSRTVHVLYMHQHNVYVSMYPKGN